MKKSVIAFALFGILPLLSANAAVYRSSSSAGIKAGNAYKTTTSARKSSGYKNTITNNFYYNAQPYQSYRDNNSSYENSGDTPVISNTSKARKTVRQTSKTSQERKYFLAHPFFQPLKGKFGSVTDISYAQANMNMTLLNANIRDLDGASPTAGNTAQGLGFTTTLTAKETTSQFVVKEDLSYGLSDTLALMLMAQYDKTDMEIKDWSGNIKSSNNDIGPSVVAREIKLFSLSYSLLPHDITSVSSTFLPSVIKYLLFLKSFNISLTPLVFPLADITIRFLN